MTVTPTIQDSKDYENTKSINAKDSNDYVNKKITTLRIVMIMRIKNNNTVGSYDYDNQKLTNRVVMVIRIKK